MTTKVNLMLRSIFLEERYPSFYPFIFFKCMRKNERIQCFVTATGNKQDNHIDFGHCDRVVKMR